MSFLVLLLIRNPTLKELGSVIYLLRSEQSVKGLMLFHRDNAFN